MDRKEGGCLGRCYTSLYQVASSSIQPFGHNRHEPKSGGCCAPFLGRGAGSSSNTMSHGPRPTSMASLILIRQTVWPQHTIVTDGQTRQTDNGPIAYKRSPRNRRNDTKCSVLIWLCRLFAAGATGRSHAAFGRPFVKRFALCYPISVCRLSLIHI